MNKKKEGGGVSCSFKFSLIGGSCLEIKEYTDTLTDPGGGGVGVLGYTLPPLNLRKENKK